MFDWQEITANLVDTTLCIVTALLIAGLIVAWVLLVLYFVSQWR